MKKYQVTLYCTDGCYRSVSYLVEREEINLSPIEKNYFIAAVKAQGIQRIW